MVFSFLKKYLQTDGIYMLEEALMEITPYPAKYVG